MAIKIKHHSQVFSKHMFSFTSLKHSFVEFCFEIGNLYPRAIRHAPLLYYFVARDQEGLPKCKFVNTVQSLKLLWFCLPFVQFQWALFPVYNCQSTTAIMAWCIWQAITHIRQTGDASKQVVKRLN